MSAPQLDPQTAFATALDMHRFGVEIMRQNLRRRDPAAPPAEIEARLLQWLRACKGDCHGRRVSWPRNAS